MLVECSGGRSWQRAVAFRVPDFVRLHNVEAGTVLAVVRRFKTLPDHPLGSGLEGIELEGGVKVIRAGDTALTWLQQVPASLEAAIQGPSIDPTANEATTGDMHKTMEEQCACALAHCQAQRRRGIKDSRAEALYLKLARLNLQSQGAK